MIELLIAGAVCMWIVSLVSGAGQDAADSAARSVKRAAADVGRNVDLVLQPCAAGRKPHHTKRIFDELSHAEITVCTVCRREVP